MKMRLKKFLSMILAVLLMTTTCIVVIPTVSAENSDTVSVWDGTIPEVTTEENSDSKWKNSLYPFEGSGTADDPFKIQSAADLVQLAVNTNNNVGSRKDLGYAGNYYFKLTVDIDLDNKGWIGIGSSQLPADYAFRGHFDGGEHTVYNMAIDGSASSEAYGFFGVAGFGASIKNLNLSGGGVDVSDKAYVGSLVGFSRNGLTVENCTSDVDVTAIHTTAAVNVGGLVGYLGSAISTFSGCAYSGEICVEAPVTIEETYCESLIGGLIGFVNGVPVLTVQNCSFTGSIAIESAGPYSGIGGMIGKTNGDGKSGVFTDCFAGGAISLPSGVAYARAMSVVGHNYRMSFSGANNGFCTMINGVTATTSKIFVDNGAVNNGSLVGFCPIWDGKIPEVNSSASYSGGNGTANTPYQISNAADLIQLAVNVNHNADSSDDGYTLNKYFMLTCDLDLNNIAWPGIGLGYDTANTSFRGVFDGGDHVISNLKIDDTYTHECYGLFGGVDSGTVKNLGLVSGTIGVTDKTNVGSLVGGSRIGLTIENCYSGVDVIAKVSEGSTTAPIAGGMVGYIACGAASLTDCLYYGTVSVTSASTVSHRVGGLAGRVIAGSGTFRMTDCVNVGNVVSNSENVNAQAASLVASIEGHGTSKPTVLFTNCYAAGTISTTNDVSKYLRVGAVVAYCYAGVAFFQDTDSGYENVLINGQASVKNMLGADNGSKHTGNLDIGFKHGEQKIDISSLNLLVENGYQLGTGGNNSVRFVSELKIGELNNLAKVGVMLNITYGEEQRAVELSDDVCYTSLMADSKTVYPAEGIYFLALGILDIPTDKPVTFVYKPYVEFADGTVAYVQNSNYTLTVNQGL